MINESSRARNKRPPETPPFAGISATAFTFLRDLKRNNDREWFRERKHIYEESLRQPLEALVLEAAAAARKRGFPLFPKHKNPLTRIYRDVRFSSDKSPFRGYLGGVLHGTPATGEYGEVYIHIEPGNPFVAAGFWMPEREFLRRWRERMAAEPGEFRKIARLLEKRGLEWLEGYSLKRLPRGFESHADSDLAAHFKRLVYIVQHPLRDLELASANVVTTVAEFALNARPLLEYGWALRYRPQRDILEAE
jgi:uncharacterized protein (TIGR02453 family)